jgi:tRNA dimethylallyltransferase
VEAPLVVIVGPTASGKSALAVTLAERYGGEIICADSRTVYKGMDIGTAKPSAEDRARVPHWGLDLVEPGERFTAADFQRYALTAIADIRSRGRIPFLVGGTGLYVDGVIFQYEFGPANEAMRREFDSYNLEQLKEYCIENNIELPENDTNRRYVMRAIEQQMINRQRVSTPLPNTIIVGITTEKLVLRQRIAERAGLIFESGVIEEARQLAAMYGWESEAMTGNIYRLAKQFLDGALTRDELQQQFETADWHLAKRQLTWLKRNPHIKWVELEMAERYLSRQLADFVQP